MVKTNIVEKTGELLKTEEIKIIDVLMKDEEIRKETVGDFSDSIEYAIGKYFEQKVNIDEAEVLNNNLKTEITNFVEKVNNMLFHN